MIFRSLFSLTIAITIFGTGCTQSSSGSTPSPSGSPGAAPTSGTVHATPVCAVQDCATGKITDNGCTPSGECASCINYCPPKGSITVTPSSTPSAKHS
jgi:hypothetical protein